MKIKSIHDILINFQGWQLGQGYLNHKTITDTMVSDYLKECPESNGYSIKEEIKGNEVQLANIYFTINWENPIKHGMWVYAPSWKEDGMIPFFKYDNGHIYSNFYSKRFHEITNCSIDIGLPGMNEKPHTTTINNESMELLTWLPKSGWCTWDDGKTYFKGHESITREQLHELFKQRN